MYLFFSIFSIFQFVTDFNLINRDFTGESEGKIQ